MDWSDAIAETENKCGPLRHFIGITHRLPSQQTRLKSTRLTDNKLVELTIPVKKIKVNSTTVPIYDPWTTLPLGLLISKDTLANW